MTATTPPVTSDDDLTRRKNARLGLFLGGIVLLAIVGFITLFTLEGLPKDPKIVARMKQEESAQAADTAPVGDSGQAANVQAGSETGPTSQPSPDQQ